MRNFQRNRRPENDGCLGYCFMALFSVAVLLAVLSLIGGVVPRGADFDVTELLLLWPAVIIGVLRGYKGITLVTIGFAAMWLLFLVLTLAHLPVPPLFR